VNTYTSRTDTAGSDSPGTITWQYYPVINIPSLERKSDERGPSLQLWGGQSAQD